MADKVYMNTTEALDRLRGNEMLFKRLLEIFLKSPEFDQFEEVLASGDIPKAADAAHGIKGMTGNLSLTELFETSTKLMNELRAGVVDEGSLAAYRDALVKTRDAVNAYLGK